MCFLACCEDESPLVQLKTSVFGAMNVILPAGQSKGQRRTDPKEASIVLSTALALKQRNNEDGKPIAKRRLVVLELASHRHRGRGQEISG